MAFRPRESKSPLTLAPEEKIIANLVLRNGEWIFDEEKLRADIAAENAGQAVSQPRMVVPQTAMGPQDEMMSTKPRPAGSFASRRRPKSIDQKVETAGAVPPSGSTDSPNQNEDRSRRFSFDRKPILPKFGLGNEPDDPSSKTFAPPEVDKGEPIKIHIHNTHVASQLRVYSQTTAKQVCGLMAAKKKLAEEDLPYYVLIMIYTVWIPEKERPDKDTPYRKVLRTLKDAESPLQLYQKVRQKPTLVYQSQSKTGEKETPVVRWVFKDKRTAPMELGGEVSGSESSDDENSFPWEDLSHLKDGDKSGYVHRKSNKDDNLWKRRWCILTSDKLWVLKHKESRCQKYTPFISLVRSSAKVSEFQRGSKFYGFELHAPYQVYHFRAKTQEDQLDWVQKLNDNSAKAEENDFIAIAEHIICDEEKARTKRHHRVMCEGFQASGLGRVLARKQQEQLLTDKNLERAPAYSTEVGDDPWPLIQRRQEMAKCYGFLDALHNFEEMKRINLNDQVEEQWAKVQRILDEFCLSSSSEKDVTFYGGIPFSAAATADIKQKIQPYKDYLVQKTLQPYKYGNADSSRGIMPFPAPDAKIFQEMKKEVFERLSKMDINAQLEAWS